MIKSKQHFLPLLLPLLQMTLQQLSLRLLLLPLILFNSIFSQINYSGTFKPLSMYRISDLSSISLPFRIAEMEIGLTKGNFDIKTISAIEYRWTGGEAEFDLREAYLVWYPNWGEVKIGKQIHAWGAVDGNNPTDNLNPYDYYYMFLPGTDRKIGTLSGSVIYYWNDWQLEVIVAPEHEPNRYPFGEKDFPIAMNDPGDLIMEAKQGSEYGLRLQTVIGNSDVGLSYFSGRDRGFTLIGYEPGQEMIFLSFAYRKTKMYGIDFVSFIGDLTSRIEAGYFSTENDYEPNLQTLENASYIQYAAQLEYNTPNDITIMGQIIGSEILEVKGLSYDFSPVGGISPMSEDDFQPGMGTPFAMFTDLGMLLSAMGNYLDNALEVRLNTFLDLVDSQTMLGGGVSYSPVENWEIDCSVSKFIGEEGTKFKEIEDFSHISLAIKYIF